MNKLKTAATKLLAEDTGATLVEYALVVLLIVIPCVLLIASLGDQVEGMFDAVLTLMGW